MKVSFCPMTRDELFDELALQQAGLEKATSALEWKLETDMTYTHESFDTDLSALRYDAELNEAAAWRALIS